MNYKETSASDALNTGEYINKLYDRRQNSQQGLMDQNQKDSNAFLNDQSQAVQNQTDAYTAALQRSRNAALAQAAYGMGSGTAANADLSREMSLQGNLTDLRRLQLGKDAAAGMSVYDVGTAYRQALESANAENELKRAQQLYSSAEDERNNLVDMQKWLGQQFAKRGDYSILNKLYGFTPEQIAKMFPKPSGAQETPGSGSGSSHRAPKDSSGGKTPVLTPVDEMWIRQDTINQRQSGQKNTKKQYGGGSVSGTAQAKRKQFGW